MTAIFFTPLRIRDKHPGSATLRLAFRYCTFVKEQLYKKLNFLKRHCCENLRTLEAVL
jgi:hypothetical protein